MGSTVNIKSTFLDAGSNLPVFHGAVIAYWNKVKGSRWAPSLAEFDLSALSPEVTPFMNITEITPKPLSSVYRYWGPGLTKAIGADYTGRSPIEVPPKTMGLSARGGCGRLVYEKVPHCEVKQFDTSAGYRGRAVVLRLPCSDNGTEVSNGIGLYKFEHVNPDADLTAFFEEIFEPLETSG